MDAEVFGFPELNCVAEEQPPQKGMGYGIQYVSTFVTRFRSSKPTRRHIQHFSLQGSGTGSIGTRSRPEETLMSRKRGDRRRFWKDVPTSHHEGARPGEANEPLCRSTHLEALRLRHPPTARLVASGSLVT